MRHQVPAVVLVVVLLLESTAAQFSFLEPTCTGTFRPPACKYDDTMIVKLNVMLNYSPLQLDSQGLLETFRTSALQGQGLAEMPQYEYVTAKTGSGGSNTAVATIELLHTTNPVGLSNALQQEVAGGPAWAVQASISSVTRVDDESKSASGGVVVAEVPISGGQYTATARFTLKAVIFVIAAIVAVIVLCCMECCCRGYKTVDDGWEPIPDGHVVPPEFSDMDGQFCQEKFIEQQQQDLLQQGLQAPPPPGKSPMEGTVSPPPGVVGEKGDAPASPAPAQTFDAQNNDGGKDVVIL